MFFWVVFSIVIIFSMLYTVFVKISVVCGMVLYISTNDMRF